MIGNYPVIYEPWKPSYRKFYGCPLCDWTIEEPPARFDSVLAHQPGVQSHDLVFDAFRRLMAELEAALREHFATHTARVILASPEVDDECE
jgi:hypothetical protein